MLETARSLFTRLHLKNKTYFQILSDKNVHCLLKQTIVGSSSIIPSRTTIIVKRLFPPGLYREGNKPRLRTRTYYYDFVEDTNIRPDPMIDIVLSSRVQGVGNPGDVISMKRSEAYNKLLICGLADYASPKMIEYSKKIKADAELQEKLLSVSVERTMNYLKKANISVVMNQFNEWKIEPWHIRVSARKAGIQILSDSSIELPTTPIKGPDMALEGKEFFVTVTINKKAKVKVRCIIHHWTANAAERVFIPEWWLNTQMLFPEDENKESTPPTSPS